MKKIFWLFLVLAGWWPPLDTPAQATGAKAGLSILLPEKGEAGPWEPAEKPQAYAGDDLYLLIDGGAEIYHEFGFVQVISCKYSHQGGRSINLEIFEMEDAAAAYGIYTFKIGENGWPLPGRAEGLLEDYYLNFWKSKYLITLTGFDADKETIEGLLALAGVIEAKIKMEADLPRLARLLLSAGLKKNRLKYLKGNLSLFNCYEFDSANIFGLQEGITASLEKGKIFIFKYENSDESRKWFQNAADKIGKSPRFREFTKTADTFSFSDRKGIEIQGQCFQNLILIQLGTPQDSAMLLETIKKNIGGLSPI